MESARYLDLGGYQQWSGFHHKNVSLVVSPEDDAMLKRTKPVAQLNSAISIKLV